MGMKNQKMPYFQLFQAFCMACLLLAGCSRKDRANPADIWSLLYETPTPTATERPFHPFIREWGTGGTGNGQFVDPIGVATDSAGNVYVAEVTGDRIQKFTEDGQFLLTWALNAAFGLAVSATDDIYVTELATNQVFKYDTNGNLVTTWGGTGPADGQLDLPYGIAVDRFGDVYVAELGNNRVQKFSANGIFILKWGGLPVTTTQGEFNAPIGVAVSSDDFVYVTDSNNFRVQKFDLMGKFVSEWGGYGGGYGKFQNPKAVATRGDFGIFVTDITLDNIQKFDKNEVFLGMWGRSGTILVKDFNDPWGVGLSSTGKIYVVDTLNNRIQVFGP